MSDPMPAADQASATRTPGAADNEVATAYGSAPLPPPAAAPARQIFSEYELLAEVGHGGMSCPGDGRVAASSGCPAAARSQMQTALGCSQRNEAGN
jgi:hypothetical protein